MTYSLPSKDPNPLQPGIYKTDVFNRNPLFLLKNKSNTKNLLVSSWDEAYALHGSANPKDINYAYVADLINRSQDSKTSPYLKISRLPRSSHVIFNKSSEIKSFSYDPFIYGISKDSKNNVHEYILNYLENNLANIIKKNSISNVGCEHSSGIDSNALLGTLVHRLKTPSKKIHTWSNDRNSEGKLIKEFRSFYNLKIENCHSIKDWTLGNHLDQYKSNLKTIDESFDIFGCPAPVLGWNIEMSKVMKDNNCEIVISGFGGDQGLSHHGLNRIPHLIKDLRFKDLIKFYDKHPAPFKSFFENIIFFLNPEFIRSRKVKKIQKEYPRNTLKKHLSVKGQTLLKHHFFEEYLWERDINVDLDLAIKNSISSDGVSVRSESEQRIANYFGIEKFFPFLDESLVSTLINQNPDYFASSFKKGRLLAREVFSDVLPPFLKVTPDKKRPMLYEREDKYIKYKLFEIEMILKEIPNFEKDLKSLFNIDDLIKDVESNLPDKNLSVIYDISASLKCIYTLNEWWRRLI